MGLNSKFQNPNTKHQIKQYLISNNQNPKPTPSTEEKERTQNNKFLGVLNLEFWIYLDFGAWDL
jgi:hypothetical protein